LVQPSNPPDGDRLQISGPERAEINLKTAEQSQPECRLIFAPFFENFENSGIPKRPAATILDLAAFGQEIGQKEKRWKIVCRFRI
jgi:hypothetical protein